LLNCFDWDRYIASATERLCLFALLRPAQLDGAVAFDRHRTLGSTNIRFAPILLQSRKSNNPKTLAEVDL
jgi:hypothetical protein